jgi:hypothetical protein
MLIPNYKTKKLDYDDDKLFIPNVADLLIAKRLVVSVDQQEPPRLDIEIQNSTVSRVIRMPLEVLASQESTSTFLLNNLYVISYRFVNALRNYLTEQIQQINAKNTLFTYKSLGFHNHHGQELFLLGTTTAANGDVLNYHDATTAFTTGDATAYWSFLKHHVLNHAPLRLAMVLGLAAPIASKLACYTDTQTIILNVCGPSSTGKTTMAQFISSLWGSPKISNRGITRTFNATANSLITATEGVNGVSIVLDDATAGGYHNFTNLVYTLAQGESKGRLKGDGTPLKQGQPWSGVVFITSETPILSDSEHRQGLIARVIDTHNLTWTANAAHATAIKQAISNHHGFIGKAFVDSLMQDTNLNLTQEYDLTRTEVESMITFKDNLTERLIGKIAIFRLTAKLAKRYLHLEDLDIDEITQYLVNFDQEDVQTRHIGEKAFNVMKLYITTNYGRFLSYLKDGTYISGSSGGNLLGRIVFNGDLAEISIPQDTVVSVLRTNKIFETRPVFQYWREHGQIHTNENNRFGVKDQNLQVRVIKFIFKRDEETLIPWPNQQPKIKKQIVTKVYQDNSVESAKAIDDIFAGDKSYEN